MIFNSIRIRLTVWYLGVLALIIIAFALGIYFLIARNLEQTINRNLSDMAKNVEAQLRLEEADLILEIKQAEAEKADKLKRKDAEDEDDEEDKTEPIPTMEDKIREEIGDTQFADYKFAVFAPDGQEIVSTVKDAKLSDALKTVSGDAPFADLKGENEMFRAHRRELRLDGKTFQLFVAQSLTQQSEFLANLRKIFYTAVPFALLLAGFGGYFLARRSLAPVVSMSRRAASIGATNLNERLPVKNERDELGGLAKIFNELLARLEDSFEQQRRFMADASHELRTPLAIVRAESEVALLKEARTAEDYRASLEIVHDESKRLTAIVEDLFLLARADSGQFTPHLKDVFLDEILRECVRDIRVLAEAKEIEIEDSEFEKMPLTADASLLYRLFLNLLDNAVKYNREAGKVSVSTEKSGGNYLVTISDTGEGISEAESAKIFERFYRVDKARRSDEDNLNGAGLGLSIAAWIAEIHHGKLILQKSDAQGSVFQVELPK